MTEEPLGILLMAKLRKAFVQSSLPFRVDIVDWASTSKNFRKIIEKEYTLVQQGIRGKSQTIDKWSKMSLSDIAELIMGQSPPSSTYNESGDGLPFFQGVRDFNYRHPSPRVFCSKPSRIAQPGDILFSVRAPIGRVNIADRECATGRGLAIIRPNNKSDTRYLEFLLRHMETSWNAIEGSGSVFGNATKQDLEMLLLLWPNDRQERCATAHILGTLDDRIELNRQMSETLEAMARALFKSWFVDFDPVHAKIEGRDLGLPRHLANLFPNRLVESELGKIPGDWQVKPLNYFGNIITGKTPSTKEPEHFGDIIPFLRIPDMHGKMYALQTQIMLSSYGAASQSQKSLPPGSVSVSCIATPGLVVLNHRETQTNQQINSIVPWDQTFSKYIYWSCRHLSSEINTGGSGGSVFGNMNKSTFSALQIVNAKRSVIQAFDRLVSPMHDKILSNEIETQVLTQVRDTLLPKLISGHLRIKDAETFLKGVP